MMSTVTAAILFLLTSYILLNYQAQGEPHFNSSSYSTSIYENVTIGTPLNLGISAIGPDNTPVTYSSFITTFSINRTTGVVSTAASIDYEMQQLYKFTVVATDEIELNQRATANVTVMVLDVNDNTPKFEPSSYTTTLPYDNLKQWSYTVRATDQDSGANAAITYMIVKGDAAELFTINAESGEIRVTGTFDPENFPTFSLVVQATDGGNPTRSSQAEVMIEVDTGSNSTTSTAVNTLVESMPCDSTAALHSVKLLLYPLLPSLVLVISAALGK